MNISVTDGAGFARLKPVNKSRKLRVLSNLSEQMQGVDPLFKNYRDVLSLI